MNYPRNIPRERPACFTEAGPALTLAERDHRCICTWVLAVYRHDGQSTFRLKYRNALCGAGSFHRRLAARAVP